MSAGRYYDLRDQRGRVVGRVQLNDGAVERVEAVPDHVVLTPVTVRTAGYRHRGLKGFTMVLLPVTVKR